MQCNANANSVSDASGSLQITEVAKGKLAKDMLKSEDVFIVDAGSELFVWIGRGYAFSLFLHFLLFLPMFAHVAFSFLSFRATKQEREKGMANAQVLTVFTLVILFSLIFVLEWIPTTGVHYERAQT